MRFTTTTTSLLLSSTIFSTTLATPVPASMNEIEKRWAAGDSEQQIHAGLSHRDMTPAWPVARDAQFGFASATDERSLEVAEKRDDGFPAWMAKVLGNRGLRTDAGNVVVLRPRKARYYFTSDS